MKHIVGLLAILAIAGAALLGTTHAATLGAGQSLSEPSLANASWNTTDDQPPEFCDPLLPNCSGGP